MVVSQGLTPQAISFQYNPHTLKRQLTIAQHEGAHGSAAAPAAPDEKISLEVEIDAVDQIGAGDKQAAALGIHPQLAALEMLLYPPSSHVLESQALLAAGVMEILGPPSPLVLFVWGPKRVLPVEITEFSVTEEAYDADLNPVRARVSLGLHVLNYSDLHHSQQGYHIYLGHQVVKEAMAVVGRADEFVDLRLGDVLKGGF